MGFESWWGDLGLPKGGGFGKKKLDIILGRIGRDVGTCNKKPHILFWYTTNFNCFDFFQTKNGILL